MRTSTVLRSSELSRHGLVLAPDHYIVSERAMAEASKGLAVRLARARSAAVALLTMRFREAHNLCGDTTHWSPLRRAELERLVEGIRLDAYMPPI